MVHEKPVATRDRCRVIDVSGDALGDAVHRENQLA
jgi:hypothetical protein